MNRIILLNLVLLLVASWPVEAGTITVKADGTGDYPTIQAAIDAAVNGDEVVAEPGIYTGPGNRDIDFLGKAVTVRSTDPNDPNVVATTIIDCNGTEAEPHRGFKFHNGEDANSILSGLTITNGYGPDELYGSRFWSSGGAVFCSNASLTITNCKITNNFAVLGGGLYSEESSPKLSSCTLTNNPGGSVVFCEDGNTTIENCDFTYNGAYWGAIIYFTGGKPTLTDCIINNNEGVISYYESTPLITNCNISGNNYGGIYQSRCSSTITNCTIYDNDGSGVYIYDGGGTITDCNISDNAGSGIYCYDSNPTIINCTISENSASGISGWYSSPTITNCTITNNIAAEGVYSSNGGGISRCGGPITDCIISGNYAEDYGGGLYGCGGPITNCIITGNSAEEDGGGIYGCDGPIKNCTITDNSSSWLGGGLSVCHGEITNCIISRNSAYIGGGLSDCRGLIRNCIISGNSATYNSGGLEWCRHVNNCTIIGNRAEGRGGGVSGPLYAYINNIIWNNFAPQDPQLSGHGLTYSCIQDWTRGGQGNISNDPCFVDPGYWADANDPNIIVGPNNPNAIWIEGDYHLLGNSPCIDTADPNFVAGPNETDLDDNPRLIDGDEDGIPIVDMGAYEWLPGPVDLIAQLLEEVEELELPGGIENSLMAKLNSALGALEDENENNDAAAVNTLEAFINVVEAQRGKKILQAEANELIAASQEIIDLLSNR